MLEEGPGLGVCRDERRALVGIFGGNIARDGTALVENETVILDIGRQCRAFVKRYASHVKNGDLAKWLLLQVLCRFMFGVRVVDLDKLEGDFLFEKNGRNTLCAGGDGNAIECQDHSCKA